MPLDISIGPWLPDTPDFERQGSLEALNVIPKESSYGPFQSFAAISTALAARCQGACFARKADGSGVIIAGDATKLYSLSNTTFSNISRLAGGAYACPADGVWTFLQFGSLVYAFNAVDSPQQYNIDTDANFSLMTGSPPIALYAAVVGDFIMTGNQPSFRKRLQWSGINNTGPWTFSQQTMADMQDLPDGGMIQGLVGFDQSVTVFQEFCIRRGSFIGTPTIFQFGKIADNIGATISGSIASYKELIFFFDRSGFHSVLYGSLVRPIGNQRVNNWFWNNLDTNNMARVTSAIDPVNGIYALAFPDLTNTGGNPNHILLYAWPPIDRWAHVQPGNLDMVFSGATQVGFTIESLDVFGTIEQLPFPWDSIVWTGVARRLISGFDTTHKLGFFNGTNLAATVDTTESQINENKISLLRSARPMVDTIAATMSVGTRMRQGDTRTYGSAIAVDAYGNCKFRARSRYHTGRIIVPGGATWGHIQGIDQIQAVPFGTR